MVLKMIGDCIKSGFWLHSFLCFGNSDILLDPKLLLDIKNHVNIFWEALEQVRLCDAFILVDQIIIFKTEA